eukprot:3268074-Rhodomonas_salina.1
MGQNGRRLQKRNGGARSNIGHLLLLGDADEMRELRSCHAEALGEHAPRALLLFVSGVCFGVGNDRDGVQYAYDALVQEIEVVSVLGVRICFSQLEIGPLDDHLGPVAHSACKIEVVFDLQHFDLTGLWSLPRDSLAWRGDESVVRAHLLQRFLQA